MTTLITALEDSYANAAKVIAGVDVNQLALPTPCSEWDVRATLDHLIGATWMFTLVNQGDLSEVVVHTWDIAGYRSRAVSPSRFR